ncbi:16227_t:CDS:2 [Dentiscutata erythropus]|uniref:16227_t:CDS:1 n=1 Tax=Dentiscutata erythropus TaxID=1348616 RepID=A0A9N9CFL5_9GLOM|nr:16227_t:CDS:2 [Dentiscutata erythropus]
MCNWCCKKKNECPCSYPEYKKKFEYKKEKSPPENSRITVEETKRYSKSTSHNSYNCRYRKTEPFVKKFKCSFCSKLYFPKYHDEGFICWKYLPYDDPRCWNPNWYKDDENN